MFSSRALFALLLAFAATFNLAAGALASAIHPHAGTGHPVQLSDRERDLGTRLQLDMVAELKDALKRRNTTQIVQQRSGTGTAGKKEPSELEKKFLARKAVEEGAAETAGGEPKEELSELQQKLAARRQEEAKTAQKEKTTGSNELEQSLAARRQKQEKTAQKEGEKTLSELEQKLAARRQKETPEQKEEPKKLSELEQKLAAARRQAEESHA